MIPPFLSMVLAVTAAQTTVVAPLLGVGVPKNDVAILTAELRTHIGRSASYRLVTPEEMSVVDEELERQLSGGCDDASCIAELGGALGAKYLITGQVGKLGSLYTLQLKLIDIETVSAKRAASTHAGKIEALLLKIPELTHDLLDEKPSKRQVVLNATAKVASKLLNTTMAKRQPKAAPKPKPKAWFESHNAGYTMIQGLYRPPNLGFFLRGSLRLGSRFALGLSRGNRNEGQTTAMTEFDAEVTFWGSQKSGGRVGLLSLYRSWTYGPQDDEPHRGSDYALGPVVAYRHVLDNNLVFDISFALGHAWLNSETAEGSESSSHVGPIGGGIGIGWSPF